MSLRVLEPKLSSLLLCIRNYHSTRSWKAKIDFRFRGIHAVVVDEVLVAVVSAADDDVLDLAVYSIVIVEVLAVDAAVEPGGRLSSDLSRHREFPHLRRPSFHRPYFRRPSRRRPNRSRIGNRIVERRQWRV